MKRILFALCVLWLATSLAVAQVSPGTRATMTVYGESHVPFILVPSGTMSDNGTLTLGTALPTTYASAYVYLPTGAIGVGSTAGWYFAQFSSATAATVYNNPYSSGTPPIPASPLPFVTAGPGAYVQTSATSIVAYSVSVPGGFLGPNDTMRVSGTLVYASNTNSKQLFAQLNNYAFGGITETTGSNGAAGFQGGFSNAGSLTAQVPLNTGSMTFATAVAPATNGVVYTTLTQNLTINLKMAVATDYVILLSLLVEYAPGV